MKEKLIGVCGAQIFNQIPMQFINTLREEGMKRGYQVVAFSSYSNGILDSEDTLGEEQLYDLIEYIDFKGLVILTETLKNHKLIGKIMDVASKKNIPIFSVDGSVDGCYNMELCYTTGFEEVVSHVIEEHGCRKINMMAGFRGNEFSDSRIAVYKKVLAEYGIAFEPERLAYGDFWERPTRAAMERFLASGKEMPDAIVCANDAMAVTVCTILEERGYRVPENVIVTGFDGTLDGKHHIPSLTTCTPDYEGAAAYICDEIKRTEQTGRICPVSRSIPFLLEKNQSCGCQEKSIQNINTVLSELSRDVGDCSWHNIAMNSMVTNFYDKTDLGELAKELPEFVRLWSDYFRFVCLKAEIFTSHRIPDSYGTMTTILRGQNDVFDAPGETFSVREFVPRLEEMMESDGKVDTLVVRLLNSGEKVYGYIVEGVQQLNDRRLQRCNEFAMFLAHSIDTVLRNCELAKLNADLIKANKKIMKLSEKDPMTGLYNRRGFFLAMKRKEQQKQGQLVAYSVDLDHLKMINDTYGHAEGDFAITAVGKALQKTAGEGLCCGRFGGDEFVCAGYEREPRSLEAFAEQLQYHIGQTKHLQDKPYPVEASVGKAEQSGQELSLEKLIDLADEQMYENKRARHQERSAGQ